MLAYKPRARKEVKQSSLNTTIKVSFLIGNVRQGEREEFGGGRQNLKSTQNKPTPVFYLYKTGYQWGYAKRYSLVEGNTQKSKMMIWGCTSTKRLRTTTIKASNFKLKKLN
jgi:hypothetical protein